jgi:hypothetical protein
MIPAPKIPKVPRHHKQLAHLRLLLRSMSLPFEEEHRFHPERQWRFDLAIPSLKIAIEYQGHGQTGRRAGTGSHIGGHASITGMSKDADKLNAAQAEGWRVIYFTALHFDATSRAKHKLLAPGATLERLLQP